MGKYKPILVTIYRTFKSRHAEAVEEKFKEKGHQIFRIIIEGYVSNLLSLVILFACVSVPIQDGCVAVVTKLNCM